ncbi:lipopolysaccharide assembly protein LapB [Caulobacter sp. 602-1]|uniref:tetratricopeptide repeat protein n=1 Tax=Caulobacter sp. 602-1 TaxID=2492472 RepID=UPI0018F6935D|nr:TRAP transporter TatT component family protein [Caulobacter sp. 602-1]
MIQKSLVAFGLALSLAAGAARADALDPRLDGLARAWAHANYEIADKGAQGAAAAQVAADADALAKQIPGRAEPLVWEAIAKATQAGAKGGLGGLALAKESRSLLERAEKINPNALGDGSVYTSLGSLYAQVPGFPIGFGDPAKARSYLQKALAANPNGVDSNFFYGDFLMRQNDYAGASKALQKALAAPPRPGREIADKGRKAQASALLSQAQAKLR